MIGFMKVSSEDDSTEGDRGSSYASGDLSPESL